jgi:hypothetical protein
MSIGRTRNGRNSIKFSKGWKEKIVRGEGSVLL